MASETQIANMTLVNIGISKPIGNLRTENSNEAKVIRGIFDNERDYVLRHIRWPFAKQYETLGLVDGAADDPYNDDWVFAYRYPSTCMAVRRIVTDNGKSEVNQPAWEIARDSQGRLVLTDEEDAVVEITARITNAEEFDDMFASALSWKIASRVAPALSKIEKMAEACYSMYMQEISAATAVAMNEGHKPEPAESEFIRARD